MYPNRDKAKEILKEAEGCNPGPWGDHSRTAAHCAGMKTNYAVRMYKNVGFNIVDENDEEFIMVCEL